MSLTYTLVYSPRDPYTQPGDINFLCSDKRLHIRLRDYSKYQVIAGFEQKLTYLISYLINFSYTTSLYDVSSGYAQAIKNFTESREAREICECVQKALGQKVRGLKIFQNYKKSSSSILGQVSPDIFPTFDTKEGKIGSLPGFLDVLRLNLSEYLFNDRFKIVIQDIKPVSERVNKKFINKQIRKYNRATADYEQLW